MDLCEFEASLVYRVSCRIARDTQWTLSQKRKLFIYLLLCVFKCVRDEKGISAMKHVCRSEDKFEVGTLLPLLDEPSYWLPLLKFNFINLTLSLTYKLVRVRVHHGGRTREDNFRRLICSFQPEVQA